MAKLVLGQIHYALIEVLQIAQPLAKADTLVIIFVSFSHQSNLTEQEEERNKKSQP